MSSLSSNYTDAVETSLPRLQQRLTVIENKHDAEQTKKLRTAREAATALNSCDRRRDF